ncbi:MAG TPA: DUF6520 family protein [Puia sp.]|nr:DUF6520 family protein [Puia sp.]
MKRIKIVIMTTAILLSIAGAFATNRHQDCRYATQYYFDGAAYIPAGTAGVNYVCMGSSGNCTFYQVAGGYALCQMGSYTPVNPHLGKEGIGKPLPAKK